MATVEEMRTYGTHLITYDDPEEIKEWLSTLDVEVLHGLRQMLFAANVDVRSELRERGIDTTSRYFSDKEPGVEEF